jgi:hypothetical protein
MTPSHLHDHGMPPANTPRITLELEAGEDPIRGSIEHPDGTRRRFWGWLELMTELGRAAEPGTAPPASQAAPRGDQDAVPLSRPPEPTAETDHEGDRR